jgi:succinate dehydrogenase/fumarate reductase cytochrome b subunit
MSISNDVFRAWVRPRAVMRRLLDAGERENRALAILMAGCLLIFVAQWPRLVRLSEGIDLPAGAEVQELSQLIAYSLVSWLIVWPLIFYIAAGITRILARVVKGKGSGYGARLAMFWAVLASSPAALLYGLLEGFNGETVGTQAVGAVWLVGFVWIWIQSLCESESGS